MVEQCEQLTTTQKPVREMYNGAIMKGFTVVVQVVHTSAGLLTL